MQNICNNNFAKYKYKREKLIPFFYITGII